MTIVNYTITFLVIFSFTFITVFGFLSMSHASEYEHSGCIAALSGGADCPRNTAGFFDFAFFHISAFKNFSAVILTENFLFASILFSWLFFAGSAAFGGGDRLVVQPPSRDFLAAYLQWLSGRPPKQKFISWLSLHEASPTLF